MNIFDYLHLTRNPQSIYDKNNFPENLEYLFDLFDELLVVTKYQYLDSSRLPELVLTIGDENNETQMVKLKDKDFLILNLNQISYTSQLLELISFGSINQNSKLSIFHDLCIRDFQSSEILDLKGYKFKIQSGKKLSEEERLLLENSIFKNLKNYSGFEKFFKIIVTFIISHELLHTLCQNGKTLYNFEKYKNELKERKKLKIEFDYIDKVFPTIQIDELEPYMIEELFCDELALTYTWKLNIFTFGDLNPAIFGFTISYLFNSFYSFSLFKDKISYSHFSNIFTRKIFALRYSTVLFDKFISTLLDFEQNVEFYQNIGNILGQYEALIDYSNHLCFAICSRFALNGKKLDDKNFTTILNLEKLDFDVSISNLNKIRFEIVLNSTIFKSIENGSNPFIGTAGTLSRFNLESSYENLKMREKFVKQFNRKFNLNTNEN